RKRHNYLSYLNRFGYMKATRQSVERPVPVIESLIGPLTSIIDKIIPDKEARQRAKIELIKLEGSRAGGGQGAAFGDRRRSGLARPMDQPGPAKLPLRDVRAAAVGAADGPDRRDPPRSRARYRDGDERLFERAARAALRALRDRLSRLHSRPAMGEGQGGGA